MRPFRQDGIFCVISKPDWDPLKQEDSSSEGNNLHFYRSRIGRTERRGKGKLWHLLLGWTKLPHPFKGLCLGFQSRGRVSEIKGGKTEKKKEKELKKWTAVGKEAQMPTCSSQRKTKGSKQGCVCVLRILSVSYFSFFSP